MSQTATASKKKLVVKALLSIPVVRAALAVLVLVAVIASFAIITAIFAAAAASTACAQDGGDEIAAGEVPPWIVSQYDELKLPGESKARYMARMGENFGIFAAAGKRYNVQWWLLAGVSYIESRIGQNPGTSTAGAQGPMQFMPGTWAMYKDASGRPPYDIQDMYDAVFAAAKYLSASGAPGDLQRAIFAYNHAQWYVDMVLEASRKIRRGASSDTGEPQGGAAPATSLLRFPLPLTVGNRPVDMYGQDRRETKGESFFEGAELPAPSGTNVTAPVDGRVDRVGWADEYGYYVAIESGRVRYVLGRLKAKPQMKAGSRTTAGEVVGRVGRTGGSRQGGVLRGVEPHLEVRMYDPHKTLGKRVRPSGAVNPTPYLQEAFDNESASGFGAGGACSAALDGNDDVVSGDAQAVLDNRNITLTPSQRADLKSGKIDKRLIRILLTIAQNHKIALSALKSDHSKFTASGHVSNHYLGRACDISVVDGQAVTPSSSAARKVWNELKGIAAKDRPTEVGSPWPASIPGWFTDGDHQDHLHVGFD